MIKNAHEQTNEEISIRLHNISLQIQGWLDWHRKHRDRECLVTDGGTSILGLPVAVWPTHSQFENWISVLDAASESLKKKEVV